MRTPALLPLMLLSLTACQGRRLLTGEAPAPRSERPASALPAPDDGWAGTGRGRGGQVSLSAQDLAPVDLYVDARNAQWILGDDVLVEASREYFGQILSVTARAGAVSRVDDVQPDVTTITLTFLMGRMQQAVENNPRVMIGTGITVSARRTLRVRLFKTQDPSVPVALRITATGDASKGRKEQVLARAPVLQIGGTVRRSPAGWRWTPIG